MYIFSYCRIKAENFIKVIDQIVELFPTEEKDLFYIPEYRNEAKEEVGARGNLYSSYEFLRKQLKLAEILDNVDKDSLVSTEESFEGISIIF